MFFSIALLIIPWLIALWHLHPKDKQLIPLIAPLASVAAFIVNGWGVYFGFWRVYPFIELNTIATYPCNLGIFPVLGCYMVYFIKKHGHPYLIIFLITLFTTLLEGWFVGIGKAIYGNGWNLFWTFVSYFFPYLIGYWFYLHLKKIQVMN
ncbi:CBO0543 family protein [Domibacillus robiginosus]|uniref:CBO0543 family protein n=1 Tax=Domibacillus robiginosus TaxID=1071054 RepID=UPI00067C52F5|nr:CBO0543 family protein [Domibacillus robiginosus]